MNGGCVFNLYKIYLTIQYNNAYRAHNYGQKQNQIYYVPSKSIGLYSFDCIVLFFFTTLPLTVFYSFNLRLWLHNTLIKENSLAII